MRVATRAKGQQIYTWILFGFVLGLWSVSALAEWKAGAAKVDITPGYPVRLSGYGSRTTEHEGVIRPIHARALVLCWGNEKPLVLLTVDNCGVPAALRQEVVQALIKDGVTDERLAVCSSHTHCAPMLTGVLTNLFGKDIPADQQQRIDRYTRELRDHMIAVTRQALVGMTRVKVRMGRGEVRFAANRRLKTEDGYQNAANYAGPKDHSLPVLFITSEDGKDKIATLSSYACHCTTVGMNHIHSDWAGCASTDLEMRFPGMVALTAIGCGADQNPYPRKQDELPMLHGVTLAREVVRVINQPTTEVNGPVEALTSHVTLKFAPLPDKAALEKNAKSKNAAVQRHAGLLLKELKQRGSINDELPYMVQAWNFGNDLSMVFLPGEVVVDYVLRIKREFKSDRMWVNAYSNDVPCYISSERLLGEGGYEVDSSMVYYMKPGRLASGTENRIIGAVHQVVAPHFKEPGKDGAASFASPPR